MLIHLVLSGISVYYLSLERIPVSIVKTLQQKMFHFLWSESNSRRKMHLASWEIIARPYHYGGWNVKNLEWFNISL